MSHKAYIEKVLEKFEMQESKPNATPIVNGDKFSLSQCPKNDLDKEQMTSIPYASVIDSLMHAQACIRPDIAFAVGILGRY